ncbi:MAG: hypothetical protein GVY06_05045, partial [Alphaproteobacteria bacterium]|nr:hypothetical protein [Alphaproteobacteria bacterium]
MQLKRIGLTTLAGLAIAACAPSSEDQATVSPAAQDVDRDPASDAAPARPAESAAAPEPGTLAWAINGDWRSAEQRRRDVFRNPAETLDFLGVSPDATIVEMWPGSGWYTQILAPYLAAGGGQLIAAGWDGDAYEGERAERIAERNEAFREAFSDEALYGNIAFSAFSGQSGELAAPGRADLVLTFRNLHNWMSGGYADKFYADAFEALRPGGILGIVEHRLPSTLEQDPTASSGYVHEDFVKAAA